MRNSVSDVGGNNWGLEIFYLYAINGRNINKNGVGKSVKLSRSEKLINEVVQIRLPISKYQATLLLTSVWLTHLKE